MVNHRRRRLALVTLYGPPDAELRAKSFDTLWVCKYGGDESLLVLDVKSIQSVVSMVPFLPHDHPEDASPDLFFVNQDLGLDVADLDGHANLEEYL
jgi:hypothetical protein